MNIFKLFMVLDMLKSNLRDYLYAREQEEKYIFIFFKLLKDTHRALSMILFFPRYTKNKNKTHNILYIVEKIIKFPKY